MNDFEETPDPVIHAFDEYVAEFRKGHGDPSPFLERFEGSERKSFETLIESFVATGPESSPDPGDPRFNAVFEKVLDEVSAPAGGLSEHLALLRQKAGKTQAAVVAALAKTFEATPQEQEKIDEYYHRLEWGSLPASGLDGKLYSALAAILGVEPESLKEAAGSLGSRYGASSGPVFARSLDQVDLAEDASIVPGVIGQAVPDSESRSEPSRPDRIDELFTGG